MTFPQHMTIMILEDNRLDVYLLEKALRKAEIDFTSIVHEDGESAFRYIDGEARGEMRSIPDVAILDLNMPNRDGGEVLAHIRSNPKWRHIVVLILSSSPKRIMLDRAAQADGYITKPVSLKAFLEIGEEIRNRIEAVRATRALLSATEIAERQQLSHRLIS
jgi:CheY-like chemotaxis protein